MSRYDGECATVRIIPVGLRALLVEVAEPAHTAALVADLHRWRDRGGLAGVQDVVPGELTVLVDGLDDPAELAGRLAGWRPTSARPPDGPLVEVPVRYDGADLAEVARLWGVAEEEVGRIHGAPEYRVAFCGFAPGFGYLTGLPERYHLPRRAVPRTRVPAGAVALAGGYAGIYPRDSPGGWQLLGSTDLVLFDPARDPVALLTPGARVRFRDVDAGGGRTPRPGVPAATREIAASARPSSPARPETERGEASA
ncbi:allophanate hydrolase [Plantactinospora mayteni]|uniref:Allophanate hydrolase n=1 Tax=Plantactinospora mayteni TaxID=566021 RepID=A0ABQ4EWN0_9ACTN|nr:allophanate hydrolase [Plantactinospora mayteni]